MVLEDTIRACSQGFISRSQVAPILHQKESSVLTTYWSDSDDLVDWPRVKGV